MNAYVVMPVWMLLAGLGLLGLLSFLGAWVNAWIAVHFCRRGGHFAASPLERLGSRRERRELKRLLAAETLDSEFADPDDEGRVLP